MGKNDYFFAYQSSNLIRSKLASRSIFNFDECEKRLWPDGNLRNTSLGLLN